MASVLRLASILLIPFASVRACIPNTWEQLASLPSVRQEHTFVVVNDTTLAIIGGCVQADGDQGNLDTTDIVQLYDIDTDSWSDVAPVPFAVNHPNAAVVSEKIYVLGGLVPVSGTNEVEVNWTASGQSAVWDPSTDTWSTLPDMTTARGSANVEAYGEMIYLAGGMTYLTNTGQNAVATVDAFNTTSGEWQSVPSAAANLPEPRQHSYSAVIGSTFYVVAGRAPGQLDVKGTVYYIDLENISAGWSQTKLQQPTPRGGISGGAVGGRLYGFGGEGDPNTTSGVFPQGQSYNTLAGVWTEDANMAVPRHGSHAASVGGKIYIPGGGLQQDGKAVNTSGIITYSHSTNYFDAYCA